MYSNGEVGLQMRFLKTAKNFYNYFYTFPAEVFEA